MKRIGIIGGGFAGTMTAVHLIEQGTRPLELILVDNSKALNKGIAYHPYSRNQLLNVVAAKMSAYPGKPDHFLDWLCARDEFEGHDRSLVAQAFLPRYLYGEYLAHIWSGALATCRQKDISITVIQDTVCDLDVTESGVSMHLAGGGVIHAGTCILATGNQLPGNPAIKNESFFKSPLYFQNPWNLEPVTGIPGSLPVLIIGNGLTMVDTVTGLLENSFKGTILSVSPNGFNILPHRHNWLKYTEISGELSGKMSLYDLVRLLHKHIKKVRSLGISAGPVIDAIRPFTQTIWGNFTAEEKRVFLSRFRHLWGVARHRIPLTVHDRIQQLRIEGKLLVIAGKIVDISESANSAIVEYYDKKAGAIQKTAVARVINCTGPETDFSKLEHNLLNSALRKGIITQDAFRLGIHTNPATFEVFSAEGIPQPALLTLGGNLKGELWESTAVPELRVQAERMARLLL